jgi:serine phosphatase RsbU (regulator of sigma subunit)
MDIAWPPGGVMLFYTDGLVERRGADLDDRLDELVAAVPHTGAEEACVSVMHELIGGRPGTDDVAVLAVRRTSDRDRDRPQPGPPA